MVAGTVRPQSGVRAATARRMSASKQEVPHFYVQTEVELDALEAAVQRARLEEPRMRVTMTAGLAQACGRALRDCPRVNSVWTDEGLLEADEVNLGVAMALGDGLIVPVLLAADRLGLRQLAAALEDLRLRAETRKLRAPEISEATFTLSNLGMTSVTARSPRSCPSPRWRSWPPAVRSSAASSAAGRPARRR